MEKQGALGRLRIWSLKIEALATKHPSFVRDAEQAREQVLGDAST